MRKKNVGTIVIKSVTLLVVLGAACQCRSQDAPTPYLKMAPIEEYLMDRTSEVTLARSAAPESISRDATVLVLGRTGYKTAVQGNNGFVCFVGRSWLAAFDWSEFWNPKVRAADCLNREAARSIVPIITLRARMVMASHSKAEIVSALRAAYAKKQLPHLDSGAMDYMMSKSAYLTDEGGAQPTSCNVLHSRQGRQRLGFRRSGLTCYVQSLLVLLSKGTTPNERAATDSCVLSGGRKLVRRNAC